MTELEYFWNVSPQNVAISETEVHVWRACLEPEEPKLRELSQTLSSDERTKADRFYFERDRNHFIAAHGFLRAILGRYSDMNPAHITFSYSPHGKPLLTWPLENICFNMSHSNGLALYAVTSNRHVGIDVEYVRPMPDAEELAKHFFLPVNMP
ncbi:4'-phosphopantetheinyl transferase family protein [Desulfonema magnum]|uniref:Transferase domain-containing protein n=1 Tax=Desulfonema magnum TaxID=45655 RepID=A0A975BLJ8_9BACT|nr:hypothetical protein [Desulfonema magnum]QTA87653.1 transferase domain-containing protein [Desulfonema magnum]